MTEVKKPLRTFMEDHFTAPRLQNYLMECKGDKGKAILLYRWNSELSAAFWESIGYLEVALRNRIDHHHRIWAGDVDKNYLDLLTLAGLIDEDLREWISLRSAVSEVLARRRIV